MALVHGAGQIVVRGLVLYLDAANRKSYPSPFTGTTWTDLSGNGNTGTLTNGPTYNSSNGGSLTFDGLDDFGSTSCSQFQSGNNPFTIELWFRWFGNGTNDNNILFAYGDDEGANRVPLIYIISGSNTVQFEFGSLAGAVSSSTFLTNTWYQTVCTYNLSSTQIYLNGSLQNTTSYSNLANIVLSGNNGQTAGIGCLFSRFGNVGTGATRRYATFNGNISVVKYYNRALTATEVAQNYNALKSRYINLPVPAVVTSGLQMYLDAGNLASYNPSTSGLTWTDLSGNGNNGTLVNTPTYSSANGGTLVFDGSNQYVNTTFATTGGQAVTYAGWVYSTETTATYKNFMDGITQSPMIWWNTSGRIEFDGSQSGGFTTTPVYRNQWVYVVLSKPSGSSSASYYVNGFLVGTGSPYSTPALTPTWLNRETASQPWKGNCSIIQAYNRALTAAEVRQNFDATRSRYGI